MNIFTAKYADGRRGEKGLWPTYYVHNQLLNQERKQFFRVLHNFLPTSGIAGHHGDLPASHAQLNNFFLCEALRTLRLCGE